MSGTLSYVVKGAKTLFKLFTSIFKKFNDLVVASSRLDLSLHRYPLRRQKFEPSAKTFHCQEYNELRYSQFATLRVKGDGFEVISKKSHRT